VVQLSQGIVPSEVVPLAQAVQVLLAKPKSSWQLVQKFDPAPVQPLQLGLQSVQRKVVALVNWVLLQVAQVLLNRPEPVAQDRQLPVVALQVTQPVQVWQVPWPLELKELAPQARQMGASISKPELQLSHDPLVVLQVKQLTSQAAQAADPVEKVPLAQTAH